MPPLPFSACAAPPGFTCGLAYNNGSDHVAQGWCGSAAASTLNSDSLANFALRFDGDLEAPSGRGFSHYEFQPVTCLATVAPDQYRLPKGTDCGFKHTGNSPQGRCMGLDPAASDPARACPPGWAQRVHHDQGGGGDYYAWCEYQDPHSLCDAGCLAAAPVGTVCGISSDADSAGNGQCNGNPIMAQGNVVGGCPEGWIFNGFYDQGAGENTGIGWCERAPGPPPPPKCGQPPGGAIAAAPRPTSYPVTCADAPDPLPGWANALEAARGNGIFSSQLYPTPANDRTGTSTYLEAAIDGYQPVTVIRLHARPGASDGGFGFRSRSTPLALGFPAVYQAWFDTPSGWKGGSVFTLQPNFLGEVDIPTVVAFTPPDPIHAVHIRPLRLGVDDHGDHYFQFGRVEFLSAVRPADIFCGHDRRFKDDGPTAVAGTLDGDYASNDPIPACMDSASAGDPGCTFGGSCAALIPRETAVQNAELRGWLVGNPSVNAADDEVEADISLDVGWDAAGSVGADGRPTVPMNTPAQIAAYVPAQNMFNFDGRLVGSPSTFFGGAGKAIVHIETDFWGPGRGGSSYIQRIPPGWTWEMEEPGSPRNTPIYFPMDISLLKAGDYVRVVGTFWKDQDHNKYNWGLVGGGLQNPNPTTRANQCMRVYTATRSNSWREMHTPDIFEAWPDPKNGHTLLAYAACEPPGKTESMSDTEDLSTLPFGGPPAPGARMATIAGPYGNDRDAGGSVVGGSESAVASAPMSVTVSLGMGAGGQGGAVTRFYDVLWTTAACVPQTCAGLGRNCGGVSDGCGGTLTCGTCGGGRVCRSGVCVPPPPPFDCSSCGCGCDASNTACYAESCPRNQRWDESTCSCACAARRACPAKYVWDDVSCSCTQ